MFVRLKGCDWRGGWVGNRVLTRGKEGVKNMGWRRGLEEGVG